MLKKKPPGKGEERERATEVAGGVGSRAPAVIFKTDKKNESNGLNGMENKRVKFRRGFEKRVSVLVNVYCSRRVCGKTHCGLHWSRKPWECEERDFEAHVRSKSLCDNYVPVRYCFYGENDFEWFKKKERGKIDGETETD